MKTDDIVKLSKRDRSGRGLADIFTQDSSTNAVYEIAGIEGRLKDPRIAPMLDASPDMVPARHRAQLNEYLANRQNELVGAVLGDIDNSVKGLADSKAVANYLLASPLKPAVVEGFTPDWVKNYAAAREAQIFLNDPEKEMSGRVNAYAKGVIDSLVNDKVDGSLISGLAWTYQNRPQVVQDAVVKDANMRVGKFTKELDVAQGRRYVAERVKALKVKDQVAEAYRLGQALSG